MILNPLGLNATEMLAPSGYPVASGSTPLERMLKRQRGRRTYKVLFLQARAEGKAAQNQRIPTMVNGEL